MADITITNDGNDIILSFTFRTPQSFFYIVEVVDDGLNVKFHDQGQSDNKTLFDLGKASDLVGLNLTIDWTELDPNGSGNNFHAFATAIQSGAQCPAIQDYAGQSDITTGNPVTTIGRFVTI